MTPRASSTLQSLSTHPEYFDPESELHELGQGSCALLPGPQHHERVSNGNLASARSIYPSQLWVVFGLKGRSLGVVSYF